MQEPNTKEFDSATEKNIEMWLKGPIDEKEKIEIRRLIRENPKELSDGFYSRLTFGTGGLRGVMGIGSNRMNQYTVQMTTQGLASYLIKVSSSSQELSVIIGYDSRHNSRFFAETSARVLAGNGIRAYLFNFLSPTPLVSFGCRLKQCSAAIMVTASHNPKEYNGYKVYWKDGGQVVQPHDAGIIKEVKSTDLSQVKLADSISHPLIESVGMEVFARYLEALKDYPLYPDENVKSGKALAIVYSSLHGTGGILVPKTLQHFGFQNVIPLKDQCIPDGDFPTVKKPNPEEPEALEAGIAEMEKRKADLLIATDPDADRMGVVISHHGKPVILNGNQIACISLYHICKALHLQNRMPEKAAFVKTIATTELFKVIAEHFGGTCFDVLTGFKYIAEKIREWELTAEGLQYIFGGEESYGYLYGTHARDKDALVSSLLIAEAALHAKLQGKTLVDILNEIYDTFGFFTEMLQSIEFDESQAGREKMAKGILRLSQHPPKSIAGTQVLKLEDYKNSVIINLLNGERSPLTLPTSDAFLFWLEDRTKVLIRPSGTEPKIKIYCSTVMEKAGSFEETETQLQRKALGYLESLKMLFESQN